MVDGIAIAFPTDVMNKRVGKVEAKAEEELGLECGHAKYEKRRRGFPRHKEIGQRRKAKRNG